VGTGTGVGTKDTHEPPQSAFAVAAAVGGAIGGAVGGIVGAIIGSGMHH
jgi:hypothetical protein